MDLTLTEIQNLLQNSTREFLEDQMPKSRVLEIDDSESGFASDIWQQIAELGYAGMLIPEEYGGSGNSYTDMGVVYEMMGYYACPSPHHSSAVLAAHAVLEAGTSAQKESILPAIASGQQIFAFAYTEPDYGWGPGVVQLPATKRDGAYVLNGAKLFIPDANVCDQMIVVARTSEGTGEDGISMFVVDSNSPGVSVRVQTGWIGPKVCEVNFENVEVPASNALGEIGGAWPAVEAARDRGTALISVFMAGGTQRVYDMAREYSQTRIAFGVPIGTFQRVQDHVIDALNDADSAKWSAFEALWQLDEGMASAPVSVSMAKSIVSVGFPRACDASHHVHGGIGTDLEYGLTQYTKRARTLQHYLGDAQYHKARMARLLEL